LDVTCICPECRLSRPVATLELAKLPATAPATDMNVKVFPLEGVKFPELDSTRVPPREAFPPTPMKSCPVPASTPPSSMARVLEGPIARLPVMMRAPGENPGATVPPLTSKLPSRVPVPARTPP
jgi:hypothetical protein